MTWLAVDPYSLIVIFVILMVSAAVFYKYIIRSRHNLNSEQIKLHATLVGNLANIILGAGLVAVLVAATPKLNPANLTSVDWFAVIGNGMVVFGSASAWCLLHLYAIKLMASSTTAVPPVTLSAGSIS